MKRYLNKVLAGVMVGVSTVTMTACSVSGVNNKIVGNKNQKIPMGRYMEENIEIPSELEVIIEYTVDKTGNMNLYGYSKDNKAIAYTTADGNTWEQKNVSWFEKLQDEKSYVVDLVAGQDGIAYVIYGNSEMEYKVGRVRENEMLEEIILIEEGMPTKIEVLENGDILVGMNYAGATRYSRADGSRLTEYESSEAEFTVVGDKLALVDIQREGVVFYNLESGKEENIVAYKGIDYDSKLVSDSQGNLYVVSSSGINRLAQGGSTWENIIEAGMSSFSKPSLYAKDISVHEEGFNVLFIDQAAGYKMIKYTYNPDIPNSSTTEVNVYMLEDNSTIRQAAAEYQSINPEVLINLQVGVKPGETMTKPDAIRALNTELLAGKGPDILILDGLPIESYVDKGVLLDMNEFISPMIEKNELLPNIMEAYQKDNQIYALPTSFKLPMMWGDADLLKEANSVEDLAAWGRVNEDKQVMYSISPEILMKEFFGVSATTWLDENGHIKELEFAKFLEAIKILADENAKKNLDEYEQYEMQYLAGEHMAYSDTQVHIETLDSFLFMSVPYSLIHQRGNGDFKVMESNGKGIYKARGIVGINANSKNIDIAKEIVETSLSNEVQRIDLGEGFAVNTEAFNTQSTPDNNSDMVRPMMGGRDIEFVKPGEEVYKKVVDEANKVNQPAYDDEILLKMILEETKGYFDGTKTAEETARAVAQRTKAYLAE